MFLSGGRSERYPSRDNHYHSGNATTTSGRDNQYTVGVSGNGAVAGASSGAATACVHAITRPLSFLPSIRGSRHNAASVHAAPARVAGEGRPQATCSVCETMTTKSVLTRLPGFRFVPTDEELVVKYLMPRAAASDARVRQLCASRSAGEDEAQRRERERLIPEHNALAAEPWDLPGGLAGRTDGGGGEVYHPWIVLSSRSSQLLCLSIRIPRPSFCSFLPFHCLAGRPGLPPLALLPSSRFPPTKLPYPFCPSHHPPLSQTSAK